MAVDGASLDHISLAVAQGRLPNFGRVLDTGVATHLATLRPTQAEPIWTTVATGRLPQTSGVRSAARYRARPDGPALDVLPDYMFAQALVRCGLPARGAARPRRDGRQAALADPRASAACGSAWSGGR